MTDPSLIPNFEWLQRLPRLGGWPHRSLLNLVRATIRHWERPLHALPAELGLPPVKRTLLIDGQFSPRGTLALFDPSLAAPSRQRYWHGRPAHHRLYESEPLPLADPYCREVIFGAKRVAIG